MAIDKTASRVALRYAAQVGIGPSGQFLTWQAPFKPITTCVKCGGPAELALVVREGHGEREYVSALHPNDPQGEGFWLHDAGAFATYLCRDIDCATATTLWNQA